VLNALLLRLLWIAPGGWLDQRQRKSLACLIVQFRVQI